MAAAGPRGLGPARAGRPLGVAEPRRSERCSPRRHIRIARAAGLDSGAGRSTAGCAAGQHRGRGAAHAPGFAGCAFRDRCDQAMAVCAQAVPLVTWRTGMPICPPGGRLGQGGVTAAGSVTEARSAAATGGATPAIELREVCRAFVSRGGFFTSDRVVRAVDGLSVRCRPARCWASSASRLRQVDAGAADPGAADTQRGEILVDGRALDTLDRRARARLIQPVFQDPFSSLNPRRLVHDRGVPLAAQGDVSRAQRRRRVDAMLERVGLSAATASGCPPRYPAGSASGWRSRAHWRYSRASWSCDEPTSALDVSVQAQTSICWPNCGAILD